MIEKWKRKKRLAVYDNALFYWLQRLTDIKWLYHVLLLYAYFLRISPVGFCMQNGKRRIH